MGERWERVGMTAEGRQGGQPRTPRLAVLLSGTGRTLENLLRAIEGGVLAAEIVVVVSSVERVRGLEIARAAGIPAHVVRRRDSGDDLAFSQAVYATVAPYRPHVMVLAGFLRRLVIPSAWEGRILNIHPALLPESTAAGRGFFGARVHAEVLASGATESGATVHVVDDEYDAGPVVARVTVPVLPGDDAETLAARVFAAECELYPRAIAAYLAGHPELLD
jgi:formyltetrahydrofolate-dependent phosphoribosylglycinamide formyltransferase